MITIDKLVEVRIAEEEDFLKIKETLTRIGVASRKDKKLYQSCHILHKQSKYYIVHFKELFALDGKPTDFTDEDQGRRNTICQLLEEWNLIKVIESEKISNKSPMSQIKILSHKEKNEWILEAKYNIGRKKK
jgi:hypothetical protein